MPLFISFRDTDLKLNKFLGTLWAFSEVSLPSPSTMTGLGFALPLLHLPPSCGRQDLRLVCLGVFFSQTLIKLSLNFPLSPFLFIYF